jgi:hypothetical protein
MISVIICESYSFSMEKLFCFLLSCSCFRSEVRLSFCSIVSVEEYYLAIFCSFLVLFSPSPISVSR